MARYIDADKLIERVNASCAFPNMGQDGYFLRDCIIDIISKQPTADVVEVVRCKSCVHYQNGACNHFGYYTYAPDVDEEDFCSYGERKVE